MLRRAFALVFFVVLVFAQLAAGSSANLIRFIDSAAGRFVFLETERGSALVARAIGRPLAVGEDISPFLSRLGEKEMSRVASKLEQSIARIEQRFLQQYPDEAALLSARGRSLHYYEKVALGRIITKELRISSRFFPEIASPGSYQAAREAYLKMIGMRPGAQPILRYPMGIDASKNPSWNLMFGFESEYALRDAEKLLAVYGPKPGLGVSPGQWRNMSPSERAAWVKANLRSLFPTKREPGGLIKLSDDPELDFLPNELILDSTGNLEIVTKPVQTLEQWHKNVSLINERLGVGSMQGTVSVPSDAFFGRVEGRTVSEALGEDLGFFNFMNEVDTLSKLEVGAARWAQDSTKEVARSFNHPFLGPMTRAKQSRLEEFLHANARGEKLDAESLGSISGSDASFKYVGGTAYRPDIVSPYRVILEVRDAHTSMTSLVDRMLRSTFHLQFGREVFAPAAGLKAFDAASDFAKLPNRVRSMLEEIFPPKLNAGESYAAEELAALQVYRNFAYPVRDWESSLAFIGKRAMKPKVAKAQTRYVAKLERVEAELALGRLTKEQASLKVQGAIAEFSTESGLAKAFRDWQARNLFKDKAWNKYVNLVLNEMGPLQGAFRSTVWEGSITSRLARFEARWPGQVKLVDDVMFPYGGPEAPARVTNRKVLVISKRGLTQEHLDDYIDAISRGTISFPLGPQGGHLYNRVGDKLVDLWTSVNVRPYAHYEQKILEPVVALSPAEELRLRFHVEMLLQNRYATVGGPSHAGSTSARTNGKLRDNRPQGGTGEAHNCTSWICTAPVGDDGSSLASIVGATPANEVHTNPGWWTWYLTGAAKAERVPVVVYWTDEPLETALQTVRTNVPLLWNFRLE